MLAGVCGRYAASRSPEDLVEEFEVERVVDRELPPSWNVAPTDPVRVVLVRRGDDGDPERQLRTARWGLVPSWAKDLKIGARLINARVETVGEKPAFRKAFAARRCLLPADGYYEWYTTESGGKQPFFITRRDGRGLAMAGLYEIWRDPTGGGDAPLVWSVTVITTTAVDELGRIHDRMPMQVEPAGWGRWLDPRTHDGDALHALLQPAAPGSLDIRPVPTAVNSVRNNGPELVQPLPADEVHLAPLGAADDAPPPTSPADEPTLF
jgi:putative SOS response-associated peptidase YedK